MGASDIKTASPTNDVKGVILADPASIAGSIKNVVDDVLKGVEPGHGTATLAVDLKSGVNVVVAHRFVGSERWDLDGAFWFGKTWDGGGNIGVAVKASW